MNSSFTPKGVPGSIIKNFQILLTSFYLFAIGIGMLFSSFKFKAFGINIFDYASIFDFLIAPFADFKIFVFTIVTVFLTYLLFKLDHFWQGNFPEQYSKSVFFLDRYSFYNKAKAGFTLLCFVLYLIFAANLYGSYSYQKVLDTPRVSVEFSSGVKQSGLLIGKTSDILFLYNDNTVDVVPLNAVVQRISFSKTKP